MGATGRCGWRDISSIRADGASMLGSWFSDNLCLVFKNGVSTSL